MWSLSQSRRRSTFALLICALMLSGSSLITSNFLPDTSITPRLGTTFSAYEAEKRGLDYREAFERVLASDQLGVIRIGSYWSEVDRDGWDKLDWLVEQAVAYDKQIMLTVGVKSPRWPEYWLPEHMGFEGAPDWTQLDQQAPWLRSAALKFVTETIMRYRGTPGLIAWQVENEPLDPAGDNMWSLSDELVAAEVDLVRLLDPGRPIALTFYLPIAMECDLTHLTDCAMLFADFFPRSGDRLLDMLQPGDILGVDIYTSIGSAQNNGGWEASLRKWHDKAIDRGVHFWVTEAQAEPWPTRTSGERNMQIVTADRSAALLQTLAGIGPSTILLWGVEHWLASETNDPAWTEMFLQ